MRDRPGRRGPGRGSSAPRPSSVPRACTRASGRRADPGQRREHRHGRAVAAVDQEALDVVAERAVRAVQRARPGRGVASAFEVRDAAAAGVSFGGRRGRSAPCRRRRGRRASPSRSGLIQRGCSITKRYMSTTHSAPSGPVRTWTGRNQLSVEARNSEACSSSARWPAKVTPSGVEDLAVDQVVDRLADEGVAGVVRRRAGVAVDRRAARRGDAVGALGVVEPLERPADREEPVGCRRRAGRRPRAAARRRAGCGGVVVGQRVVPEQVAVVAAEPVAPVVADAALLRQARGRLHRAGVGPDAEVAAADVDLAAGRRSPRIAPPIRPLAP